MSMPSRWKIIHSSESQHLTIWKVKRKKNGAREAGFFKIPHRNSYKYIGPLAANEMVCNQLAQMVGLPVAKTRATTIGGNTGVLSLAKRRKNLQTWARVMRGTVNPFKVMVRPRLLYKTFVFDVWMNNIDRSAKNIIVYPKGSKYDFYLIDHELALLGAIRYEEKPWNSSYWDDVDRYTKGYHPALLKYMTDGRKLAVYVREIQSIRPDSIRRVVDGISSELLSTRDKILMKKILLRRQRRLDRIIATCVTKGRAHR